MNNKYDYVGSKAFGLSDEQKNPNQLNEADGKRVSQPQLNRAGSDTEHTISSCNAELYATACLNLIREERFCEAFRLMRIGYSQLLSKTMDGPENYPEVLETLKAKVFANAIGSNELIETEWSLVKTCLLSPIDSIECLQACRALAALYASSSSDWSRELFQAYLEEVSNWFL